MTHPAKPDTEKAAAVEPAAVSAEAIRLGASMTAQRAAVLVRHDFARLMSPEQEADPSFVPPLARLAATHGRGGGTAIHVYLVLLWRCSHEDEEGRYSTEISARQVAQVLDFKDPNEAGRRRVNAAMRVLEDAHLIEVEHRRGTTSIVRLLHESGQLDADGEDKPYRPPHGGEGDRYFKVPTHLYRGTMQQLRGPGVAMLLILLSTEQGKYRKPVWWSTSRWEQQIKLGASTRTEGTKELKNLGLVRTRQTVISNPKALTREPVRTVYTLTTKVHPLPTKRARKRAVVG